MIFEVQSKGAQSTSPVREGGARSFEETVICGICGKGFLNEIDCTEHMLSHNEPSNYKCELCEKVFNTQAESDQHTAAEHDQPVEINHQPSSCQNTVEIVSLKSCDHCEFETENCDELMNHNQRNVHSVKERSFKEIVDKEVMDEAYICGECYGQFKTYSECEKHTDTHIPQC